MTNHDSPPARSVDVGELHTYLNSELDAIGRLSINGIVTSWRPHRSRWVRAEIAAMNPNGVPTAKLAIAVPPNVSRPAGIEVGAHVDIDGTLQTHPLYNPLQLQAATITIWSASSPANDRLEAHLTHLTTSGTIGNNKRRPVPEHITSVGLVTAASGGAGLNDPATILTGLGVTARHYPVPMMGQGSAEQIAVAIGAAAIANDIVLVCRGGGATTDLAPFNTITVIDAILAAGVPVITGIGHADDHTAADRVAHQAAATPTAAAQWVQTQTKRRAEQHARTELAAQQQTALNARNQARVDAHHAAVAQQRAQRAMRIAALIVAAAVLIVLAVTFIG